MIENNSDRGVSGRPRESGRPWGPGHDRGIRGGDNKVNPRRIHRREEDNGADPRNASRKHVGLRDPVTIADFRVRDRSIRGEIRDWMACLARVRIRPMTISTIEWSGRPDFAGRKGIKSRYVISRDFEVGSADSGPVAIDRPRPGCPPTSTGPRPVDSTTGRPAPMTDPWPPGPRRRGPGGRGPGVASIQGEGRSRSAATSSRRGGSLGMLIRAPTVGGGVDRGGSVK